MIGRSYEYQLISGYLNSNKAELGVVYGRRRVGKSTLLQELHKNRKKKSIYFEGIKGLTLKAQVEHFCRQLAEQTNSMQVLARNWQDAFMALTKIVETGSYFVVFDEFPWMASERTELVSILKFYWDNHWKKENLKLILCGSIAQFMVKHLVHSQSLHNRKTFELKIDPLPCHEAVLFFKNKRSLYEATKFLMIFGGVPKYLEQINPNNSLSKNMNHLCFQQGSFFLNEFETVFKEQFRVTKYYEKIVYLLRKDKLTKEEIAKKIKFGSGGGLTTYLHNLELAEFIRQESSMDLKDGQFKAKTNRYVLNDEWLRFYFNYVLPNIKIIERNKSDGLFEKLTDLSISTYFGLSFEKFCFKNIDVIISALDIKREDVLAWGPYFRQPARGKKKQPGVQIDLLIKRRGNIYNLVECKFREDPVGISVISDVESKIKNLSLPRKITLEKVLITANGVHPSVIEKDYFHKILTLDDLYKN